MALYTSSRQEKVEKLHCPWAGPFKVVQILCIEYSTHRQKRQVVCFERLKPCSPRMRPRTQTNNRHSAQQNDRQSEVTAGEEHQAWGQVHFKMLKYKYSETFISTSTTSYPH